MLLRERKVASYKELAMRGRVTRARISQIMNLLQLAPDIQEEILHLANRPRGRDRIHLAQLQPIASELDWRKQRPLWRQISDSRESAIVAVTLSATLRS